MLHYPPTPVDHCMHVVVKLNWKSISVKITLSQRLSSLYSHCNSSEQENKVWEIFLLCLLGPWHHSSWTGWTGWTGWSWQEKVGETISSTSSLETLFTIALQLVWTTCCHTKGISKEENKVLIQVHFSRPLSRLQAALHVACYQSHDETCGDQNYLSDLVSCFIHPVTF